MNYPTPLVGLVAAAPEWHPRKVLLQRQPVLGAIPRDLMEERRRRRTPITEVDIWWPDTGGVPIEEIRPEDEETIERCAGVCGGPVHLGLCTGRR